MTPEWSRRIPADEITAASQKIELEASSQECADLARRLRVIAVEGLRAVVDVRRETGHIIRVSGTFEADVTQSCVVTLEPVRETLRKPVEGWFSGDEQVISLARVRRDRMAGADSEVPVMEEREDPEPLVDGQVDVAELVTQCLSLALNPYPHAPGVSFGQGDPDEAPETQPAGAGRPNPFAALKNWKFDGGKDKKDQ